MEPEEDGKAKKLVGGSVHDSAFMAIIVQRRI